MGLEFALTCIPLVTITNERLVILRRIVDQITPDNLDGDWDEDIDEDELQERLQAVREAVEVLPDVEERFPFDVNHLEIMPGLPYAVLFAGGYADQDDPSDIFTHFEAIGSCEAVLNQLIHWSKEDHEKRLHPAR